MVLQQPNYLERSVYMFEELLVNDILLLKFVNMINPFYA